MNGHYPQVYLGQPMMGTANTLMPMYPFYHFQQTQAMGLPAHYYSPTATATITTGPALMSKPTSIPPNPGNFNIIFSFLYILIWNKNSLQ